MFHIHVPQKSFLDDSGSTPRGAHISRNRLRNAGSCWISFLCFLAKSELHFKKKRATSDHWFCSSAAVTNNRMVYAAVQGDSQFYLKLFHRFHFFLVRNVSSRWLIKWFE